MTEITSASHLADRLKELRIQQGLSQAQLAKAVGVSRPTITYFETKKIFLKFNTLLAVMHVLGLKWYLE